MLTRPPAPTDPRPTPPAVPAEQAPPSTWTWPLLCAALGMAGVWAWDARAQPTLQWQSTTWQQAPWTLWTAPMVHLSGAHLVANLGALLCLAVLGRAQQAGRAATVAVLIAWPLGTLGLIAWPQVTAYSGMSGLLCGMLAVLWSHATLRTSQKGLSYVLFALLVLKLLSEEGWAHPIAFDPAWGFNVVYAAHFAGAVAGAVCGLLCAAVASGMHAAGVRRSVPPAGDGPTPPVSRTSHGPSPASGARQHSNSDIP